MAVLKLLKGIRPAKDKAHLIASRSVDTYSKAQLRAKLSENPFTFLHIIKPDFAKDKKSKEGSPEQLKRVKENYHFFLEKEYLVQDQEESLYLYAQHQQDRIYTGVIACASIDEYLSGKIKIHEQTITSREEKLMRYLEVCNFNAEPVFLTYPDVPEINRLLMSHTSKNISDFDFTTTDKIRHQLWKISEDKILTQFINEFKNIPCLYIADGHHRCASSALLAKNKKSTTGEEAFNFFLAAFFSESQLKIYDFNRLIKDLGEMNEEDFLNQLEENFILTKKGKENYAPKTPFEFSMYLNTTWYSLVIKKELLTGKNENEMLDAALLTQYILAPLLRIVDLKTDKRIHFMSGIKGMDALKKEVDSGKYQVAFALYPASMKQIKSIADHNNTMPPKSTWIEPKFRSGMVIYSLR